ncbi:MAG: glycosyltransferase family 87 protein [Leptospiraceae bacterium]|nr:glycosyltransferase family 87 protein [Leptospiraceae bacterium]
MKKALLGLNTIFIVLILVQGIGKSADKSDFFDYYNASNLLSEKKDIYQLDKLEEVKEKHKGANIFDSQVLESLKELQGKIASYIYPPFFAYLLIPISKLNYETASAVFIVLNFISLLVCIYLFREIFPTVNFSIVLFISLLLNYRFLESHSSNNQVALLLLLFIILSIRIKNEILSGFFLSLAIIIKLTPAIFLLYFLYKRKWNTILYVFFFGLVWIVIPGISDMEYNLIQWKNWKTLVLDSASNTANFRAWKNNQSLIATLAKYFLIGADPINQSKYGMPFISLEDIEVRRIFQFLGIVLMIPLLYRIKKGITENSLISGLFILSVIFSGISWVHSFVFLLFPIFQLSKEFIDKPKLTNRSILFILFGISTIFTSGFVNKSLENQFLMFSGLLYCAILLYGIVITTEETNESSL